MSSMRSVQLKKSLIADYIVLGGGDSQEIGCAAE